MQVQRRALSVVGGLLAIGVRPAMALEPSLAEAVARWAGDSTPRDGRITLNVAPLIDNGNTVPITVRVTSPMSSTDFVREIAIFNERNPQRDVARFTLSPANGRAEVSTRIRLATTQNLVALARMNDGTVWHTQVAVIVTLAACIEV